MNLSSLDLNLLLVLHAVLEERSVSAAARRLHVTPPAVSNSLARLRAVFDDPLFVRAGRGLAPTPRALEVAPLLRSAIGDLARAVAGEDRFDPGTTQRTFTIACSDSDQLHGVPILGEAFERAMPRARLQVVSVERLEASGGLAGGAVDVAIAPAIPGAPGEPGVHAAPLYSDEAAFVVRKGHPRIRRTLTTAAFEAARHVDVHLALAGGGIGHRGAEAYFAARGLRRDVAVVMPSFSAAALFVASTDLVAGIPRRAAERLATMLPLEVVRLEGPPLAFDMRLVWHERTHADAGSRCFRDVVISALRVERKDARPRRPRGGRRAGRT